MIYLDNNATTAVAPEVVAAMEPFYRERYGNPHSAHRLGAVSQQAMEMARVEVARSLHALPEEIYFTSCGTESNAIVLRSLAQRARQGKRRRIVATAVEHPSILAMLQALEESGEIELKIAGVDETGALRLDELIEMIDETTAAVCVMLAQNETGVIHEVAVVAAIARDRGAFVLIDAVQALGKIPVQVHELGADFLSLSGHKLHAPKGVAALYVRRGVSIDPLWYGSGQERGLRSGTEPVSLIAGLGVACRLARAHLPFQREVAGLRDHFEKTITRDHDRLTIQGVSQARLPNTSSVSFRGKLAADVIEELDRRGICASVGTASHSPNVEPTAVMRAMSIPNELALGTVRFSMSRYTTQREVDAAADAILDVCGTRVTNR